MLVQEQKQEQEQEWLGLESVQGSVPQQGPPGSDWTCSKETETLCGSEWDWAWDWVWRCSPSLCGRHVRRRINVDSAISV